MKVNFTVKKIEDDKVVLVDDNNNIVNWPKDKLPSKLIKKGEKISFYIDEKVGFFSVQEQAKAILNEILNIKN